MVNYINKSKIYSIITLLLIFIGNQSAYRLGRLMSKNLTHYDLTLPIDNKIPFLPWTVSIYFACFIFWTIIYYYLTRRPRKESDIFFCANHISYIICFLFFILLPTTNIRPNFEMTDFWSITMAFLYTADSADNLLPSIHCLVSWFCWIGVRYKKDIPFTIRFSCLLQAIIVCISTLTTRQHVIIDVFAGILLSEICYRISSYDFIIDKYRRIIDSLITIFYSQIHKHNQRI